MSRWRFPALFSTVIGIILLGGGCGPQDPGRRMTQEEMLDVQEALVRFHQDMGRYPEDSEQLTVLVEDPRIPGWKGPYTTPERLVDSWDRPYAYGHFRDVIFIASSGPNGRPETSNHDLNQGLSRGDDIVLLMPDQ